MKKMVLGESNVGGVRTFTVKEMVNSVSYSIGEVLDKKAVESLAGRTGWTVKIVKGDPTGAQLLRSGAT